MSTPTQTREELDNLAVEYFSSGRSFTVEVWIEELKSWIPTQFPSFCRSGIYRRKPTRRTVPLGPEDIKPGMVFRHEAWACGCRTFWETSPEGICLGISTLTTKWKNLREEWLYSTDGITFRRCDKEVEG